MKGDEFPLERWSEINGEIHGVLSNLWWLQQKKIVVSSADLSRQFMTRVGRLFPTTSHEFSLCFSATWWFIPRIVSGLVHPSEKSGHCPHWSHWNHQGWFTHLRFVGRTTKYIPVFPIRHIPLASCTIFVILARYPKESQVLHAASIFPWMLSVFGREILSSRRAAPPKGQVACHNSNQIFLCFATITIVVAVG